MCQGYGEIMSYEKFRRVWRTIMLRPGRLKWILFSIALCLTGIGTGVAAMTSTLSQKEVYAEFLKYLNLPGAQFAILQYTIRNGEWNYKKVKS
jgi:hypothetical protein